MIEIREVKTKKDQREFLEFPLRMYREEPRFVPPLWMDEKKIFDPGYAYYECCEAVYYLALREGETVGRISGILQKTSNELRGQKRVRFTRFDCINDAEVARALFAAVEAWARQKGMDTVCGPLGFSNLERQGLLVEGFEEFTTFEEQYNAPYYGDLLEACGYQKEIDWVERQIRLPEDGGAKLLELSDKLAARYGVRSAEIANVDQLIDRYADRFFALFEKSYAHLYQTVPFTPGMKKMVISNFKLILNKKYAGVVVNDAGEVVGIGVCFPSISDALRPSAGRLTPAALVRVLRALRKPRVLELGLIGVDPDCKNQGASIVILAHLARILREEKSIEFAETNLNMETNTDIQNLWDKRFDARLHKRRRAYIKEL